MSSGRASAPSPALGSLRTRAVASGKPGYSAFPQMHRVTPSSLSRSSSSSTMSLTGSFGSSCPLRVRRGWGFEGSSWSSDCERGMEVRGEVILLCERVLRSARPEEMEEVDELVCFGAEGMDWVVRAREERRGDMVLKGYRGSCNEGRRLQYEGYGRSFNVYERSSFVEAVGTVCRVNGRGTVFGGLKGCGDSLVIGKFWRRVDRQIWNACSLETRVGTGSWRPRKTVKGKKVFLRVGR